MTFRAILAEVDAFPSHGGPPRDLHRLEFARTVPFEARELRRLTQAADFARSLIGVRADAAGRLSIWGLIHQGPRWLQDVVGGRGGGATLPPVPVMHVVAPGSVEARCGPELVDASSGGSSRAPALTSSKPAGSLGRFQHLQDEQRRMYEGARERREAMGEQWPPLDPDLPRRIGERVMKRAIAVLRRERRGRTILRVPLELTNELGAGNRISTSGIASRRRTRDGGSST